MRKAIFTGAMTLMLSATAALAQHGPPAGAGPGGGLGAGPPISPPGLAGMGQGTSDLARGIASQQGQFGRDFAAQQHLSSAELQAQAAQHRADAMVLAQAARAGGNIPASAGPRIKTALRFDIDAWRAQFQVDRKSWQTMRDAWLAERPNMTARDWALRRADWFTARDAWISAQKTTAMARRN